MGPVPLSVSGAESRFNSTICRLNSLLLSRNSVPNQKLQVQIHEYEISSYTHVKECQQNKYNCSKMLAIK
ncbi:unnamed protein product [Sphenostylis stenocarpa]|uniref:Uncharacterized protein n=1 Tax=Sphenostylis stenocarpa TaxID=92480 RepID=A0AA86SC17_9FABA|nr:unnamed protein product [Sphenostylis stenocarpa]